MNCKFYCSGGVSFGGVGEITNFHSAVTDEEQKSAIWAWGGREPAGGSWGKREQELVKKIWYSYS